MVLLLQFLFVRLSVAVIVKSRYLRVEVHPKLLISLNEFSGPRKFTLRYQYIENKGLET